MYVPLFLLVLLVYVCWFVLINSFKKQQELAVEFALIKLLIDRAICQYSVGLLGLPCETLVMVPEVKGQNPF